MAAKTGRAARSKNREKTLDKTLEDFGVNRNPETELGKKMEEIMQQLKDIRKELQEEREAREEERRRWKEEKKEMMERIKRLEMDQERREREKRKRNLVIKGANIGKVNIEEGIEEFAREKLGVEIRVEKAYEIMKGGNKEGIVVTVKEWEMKRNILIKKKNLERGIYIDDDLTWREREIQGRLRKMAREEKERGRQVKVGYMKICIEGKWFKWNEREDCLNEEKEKRGRQ